MKIYELKIYQSEARTEILSILGPDTVQVTTAKPMRLGLPLLGSGLQVYLLDLQTLSQTEFDRLVAHIAQKYSLGRLIAVSRLQQEGFAIPASTGALRMREVEHA